MAQRQSELTGGTLGDLQRSVAVSTSKHWWRRLLAFAGPAYMVSVGYMDPGNWATDIAGAASSVTASSGSS